MFKKKGKLDYLKIIIFFIKDPDPEPDPDLYSTVSQIWIQIWTKLSGSETLPVTYSIYSCALKNCSGALINNLQHRTLLALKSKVECDPQASFRCRNTQPYLVYRYTLVWFLNQAKVGWLTVGTTVFKIHTHTGTTCTI